MYSKKSSTTSLRPHIEKYHLLEYITKAKEYGWKLYVPSVSTASWKGYSISQIREAIKAGQNLDNLPQIGGGSSAIVGVPSHRANIPIFSMESFQDALVEFVVTDDQVRLVSIVVKVLSIVCRLSGLSNAQSFVDFFSSCVNRS